MDVTKTRLTPLDPAYEEMREGIILSKTFPFNRRLRTMALILSMLY